MRFGWDPAKNAANRRKHGIEFEDAVAVFDDPDLFEFMDVGDDYDEERWIAVGRIDSVRSLVLLVVFTDREPDTRRIISARKAEPEYVREYYSRVDRS